MPTATRQRLIEAAIKRFYRDGFRMHEPAHVAAAGNRRAIEEIICRIAERAGASDPKVLAQELCLVMEGTYVMRQVTENRQTVAIARRVAERVIAAHVSQNGQPLAE